MNDLSIFVDESGDFGEYRAHSPYYIITMIFHDRAFDLSPSIAEFNADLQRLGYHDHIVHTEPLIRREADYRNLSPPERRSIFCRLYYFTLKCEIQYKTFVFSKNYLKTVPMLKNQMTRELTRFIRNNLSYFHSFRQIVLYYDNGQHELSHILRAVFDAELPHYTMKKVLPGSCKLFQSADLICTLELLRLKAERGHLTRSETLVFHSIRDLKKDFLKGIRKKSFASDR